jgi:pimeloyl-ACP methyl ester carboxylesterase
MDIAAEQVLRCGLNQRLIGLLNHRPGDAPVICLLLNVGVTGRIGPRRLNVKLARALAADGIGSLRLDLSGVGDSLAAEAGSGYQQQSVADLQAGMDAVEAATGIRRFLVLGICSGAVNAYRLAQADERVSGLMMFDGYAFPTWRTRFVHDWQRLKELPPSIVLAKLGQRLFGWSAPKRPMSIFYVTRDDTAPDQQAFGDVLDRLHARGTAVLVIYSGSVLALYNHHRQFADAFRGRKFLSRVRCLYLPHIDHIPTSQAAQTEFLSIVRRWAIEQKN